MKKASIFVLSLLVLALVVAPVVASDEAKGKTHDVTVEFVAYDAAAKTVTFKTDAGEQKTAPVDAKAAKAFEAIHAGDKVVLTCQDNAAGEHQAVTMVKPAKAEKKA
jgi:hypothetical protein